MAASCSGDDAAVTTTLGPSSVPETTLPESSLAPPTADAAPGTQIGDPIRADTEQAGLIAFSPDATRLLNAGADGLRVRELATDRDACPAVPLEAGLWSAAFTPDGSAVRW